MEEYNNVTLPGSDINKVYPNGPRFEHNMFVDVSNGWYSPINSTRNNRIIETPYIMNQSTRHYLKSHIHSLNLQDIVKDYVLDYSFVVKYILNKEYQLSPEDGLIDITFVLTYQPHLSEHGILNCDEDEDSIDTFQDYSEN